MFSFFKKKFTAKQHDDDIEMQEVNAWQKPFDTVPDDIFLYILSYLNHDELHKVKAVNQRWYELANEQEIMNAKHYTRSLLDAHALMSITPQRYTVATAVNSLKILAQYAPDHLSKSDLAVSAKLLIHLGDVLSFLAENKVLSFEAYRRTEPRVATYMASTMGAPLPDVHHYDVDIWTAIDANDMRKLRKDYGNSITTPSNQIPSSAKARTSTLLSFIDKVLTLFKKSLKHEADNHGFEFFTNKKKNAERRTILTHINTILDSVATRLEQEVKTNDISQIAQRPTR